MSNFLYNHYVNLINNYNNNTNCLIKILHKLFNKKYCPRCKKVRSVRKIKIYNLLNKEIKIYYRTNYLCSVCSLDLDKLN